MEEIRPEQKSYQHYQRMLSVFSGEELNDVDAVLRIMAIHSVDMTLEDIGPVKINGSPVRIPMRIYLPELYTQELGSMTESQKLIWFAIGTRHNDGIWRERSVLELLGASRYWSVPFIIQLVGEYVSPIIKTIRDHIARIDLGMCARFKEENQKFVFLTEQRVVSYWNEYYRQDYPVLSDYPGVDVMRRLGMWNGDIGKRLLRSSGM